MKKSLLSGLIALSMAATLNAATVATVDGVAITDTEVNALLAVTAPGATIDKIPADAKKQVINSLIDRKLIIKDAQAKGIDKDAEFVQALANVREQVLVEAYMKKIFDTMKASDADAKAFYDKNKEMFNQPASARARHILVEKEADATAIISELKGLSGDALTKKFAELASTKSIDKGSASQGGELGWFGQSQMVKPFADAAFALKNGQISQKPVKSNFGYHIILKEESKPAGTIPFNDVKEQIIHQLKMEKFQQNIKAQTDALKAKAKIEYK
ncbi:peptidyl-prolyl cis-trans isomerase [Campylobacter sp. 9BO]|uniref:peptidylprolyl isomerase n=1 Tax=Campylobacter sp. 9BO TaxID=3424759 RepID=UPI003D32FEB8